MDFKGTRGKWEFSENGGVYVTTNSGMICDLITSSQKDKADALLISKSPEMLEKLSEIVNILDIKCTDGCVNKTWRDFQNGNGEDVGLEIDKFIKDTKQLIKEATEL